MNSRVIAAASRRRMPWKNGGGETFEIAASPEGAGLAAFDWRISMATVSANGPFSVFPGIDRTICVLEGAGLKLRVEDREPFAISPVSPPLAFSGDESTNSTLTDGAILDLNVMTRRARFVHAVDRVEFAEPLSVPARSGISFVVCARGRIEERSSGSMLSAHDTLAAADAAGLLLRPVGGAATALLIHIFPHA